MDLSVVLKDASISTSAKTVHVTHQQNVSIYTAATNAFVLKILPVIHSALVVPHPINVTSTKIVRNYKLASNIVVPILVRLPIVEPMLFARLSITRRLVNANLVTLVTRLDASKSSVWQIVIARVTSIVMSILTSVPVSIHISISFDVFFFNKNISDLIFCFFFCKGPCNQLNCGYGNCLATDHVGVCKCFDGFNLVGDSCVDVNECLQKPCHVSAL